MKVSRASRFLPILALGYAPSQSSATLYDVPIETEYGTVQGFKYFNSTTTQKYFGLPDSDIAAFLGVPYAADTAYENRWKPAQPRERWNGTLKATKFGPACPIAHQAVDYTLSEDCLSVNIWTPATSPNASLPVLVWNYGSGETSAEPLYDGGGLATKDVIVVSYNYRDAAFGFLAHPTLNEESGQNSSGNYGILDFITALEWVQKNIANFGGDPNKVTIAGESFGSAQVYHAVNSPLAKGLFRGMIAESGIRYPYDPLLAALATSYRTMDYGIETGLNYTSFHNVSSIAELRTLSMEELLVGSDDRDYSISNLTALWTSNPPLFKSTLDDYVIPMKYIDELIQGPANDVVMMTGNNRDESGASTTTNFTLDEFERYNTAWYGNLSSEFFKLYPASNSSEGNAQWNQAACDLSLVSSYLYANGWIKSGASSPFYTYYWDHARPGTTSGAAHMTEINYVLRNLYATDLPWTAYDHYVADVLSSYWANFVKTGNPNLGGSFTNGTLATWSANQQGNETVMHLGEGFGSVAIATPEKVDLLTRWMHGLTPY
ncbi:carboxylesterase [Diplodia corticola]|uniref:Carboxylesterase n=1 Tax=Diplodia corticola TaxID=236234 RepID=A0A1J9SDQ0_9PEZI|nr:carboxylesterase [Diplodia corticola]OJD38567.1 carboxylesterase [Diplodia corticola]